MPCMTPLTPTITFQMSPPLKFSGVCVMSVHSSASLSFQMPRECSRLCITQLSLMFYTSYLHGKCVPSWDAFSNHSDQGENLLRKCDEESAKQAEEALRALAGVVALDAHTDLHDAPAEDDDTDSANTTENKITEIGRASCRERV